MKILIAMAVKDQHIEWFQESLAEHELVFNTNPTGEDVVDVDVIIGNVEFSVLKTCKQLRLLQLNTAGADDYCKKGVVPEGAVLTNATGAYGLALSEYCLATILSMFKHLPKYYEAQGRELWQDMGEVKSIVASKFLLVGFGDIGEALGKKLNALGGEVWAIKRRLGVKPSYIHNWGTLEDLQSFVSQVDVVVNILPGSEATTNIFNKRIFNIMAPGSYFVNVGRGSAVVEADLCKALEDGHLAGAAIDVMGEEPLSKGSSLWHCKNLYITPHTAGQYHLPSTQDKVVKIAINNVQSLAKGSELRNVVDMATGYKK